MARLLGRGVSQDGLCMGKYYLQVDSIFVAKPIVGQVPLFGIEGSSPALTFRFQRNKSLAKIQYCRELGLLRQPELEFRILCLKGSVI